MAEEEAEGQAVETLQIVIASAAQIPGVKISREKYLASALRGKFSPEVVALAIASSPAAAGISPDELSPIADASIRYEATKVTALSAVAGLPGGLAAAGTVPADLAQYFAHVIRISQKLAYLYGWENIFEGTAEELDDEAKSLLILFMGVMFGANGAADAVAKIAQNAAGAAQKQIAQKALTKGVVYPVVKKVSGYLGVKMTRDVFAKGVSKVIPLIGGVISGGHHPGDVCAYVPEAEGLSGGVGDGQSPGVRGGGGALRRRGRLRKVTLTLAAGTP